LQSLELIQVDQAIAFETQLHKAKAGANGVGMSNMMSKDNKEEPELVSREVQAGLGLLTGVVIYSMAFGGLFALAFGCGRVAGTLSPQSSSA
jgi:hypothetical protein